MGMGTQPIIGVFEGGGIKGVALAGAAAATMDSGYHFQRIVGTSAGALVGALVASGYSARELREVVCEIDWPSLLDATRIARVPVIGKQLAVLFRLGLYKGSRLEAKWAELLSAKGVARFADLPIQLRVVATDVTHTKGLIFPDELEQLSIDGAEVSVAQAVRMSASVPFAFEPVRLRNVETGDESLVVDGALAANFPERIVDIDAGIPAVGFRFVETDDHPHREIRGPLSYASAVMWSGVAAREGLPAFQSKVVDIIEVPSERIGLDFDLTRGQARVLFDEGYEAVRLRLRERPLELP